MSFKLSILTPHKSSYDVFLDNLRAVLEPQCGPDIEWILWRDDGQATVGTKRNWLLQKARGEYLCFVDSDDLVSDDYIEKLRQGMALGVDCCSLTGEITDDGKNPRKFVHSMMYKNWYEKDGVYVRPPNHLNCIKSSIAKQIPFPDKRHGEDQDWSMRLLNSGLIKTEHWIEGIIYHYLHRNKK